MGDATLIRILRFGVIVLSAVILGLLAPMGVWFISKAKALAPENWTAKFMAVIIAVSGVAGGAMGAYDYMAFDPEARSVSIYSVGIVLEGDVAFGVYWDATATSAVTSVEWGELEPGQTGNVTFYIKNEGPSNLYATMLWTETSWDPPDAFQYFDLTWDFGDKFVKSGFGQKVRLQLQVHNDIIGIEGFSFDIVITGDNDPF